MHAQEIKDRLADYLAGRQSLEQFEDWFMPLSWNITRDKTETPRLAGEVWLLLAEHDRGDRTDTDFKAALAEVLARETSAQTHAQKLTRTQ